MTPRRSWIPAMLLVGVVGGLLAGQLSGGDGAPGVAAATPQGAQSGTVTVERGDVVATLTLSGYLVAHPQYVVDAPGPGAFEPADLAPGDLVRAGDRLGSVGGSPIHAVADATLVEWLLAPGATAPHGVPVATLQAAGFAVQAAVAGADAYRILAGAQPRGRALVQQGPGPFDCAVVSTPDPVLAAAESAGGGSPAGAPRPVLCLVPTDVRAVDGVPAELLLASERAADVLLLPVHAVSGTVDAGEVDVIVDGTPVRRAVTLGLTDGSVVVIESGLAEGDVVMAAAPRLAGG